MTEETPEKKDRDYNKERNEREEIDRNIHYPRDYYDRPTAISLFLRLGYDITNNDDVQRLAADMRWAAERRKETTEQKPHRLAMVVSGFIALASVALTVFGQWLLAKISGTK